MTKRVETAVAAVWQTIRDTHPDVPDVVTKPASAGSRPHTHAAEFITRGRDDQPWLVIDPDRLAADPLGALLHTAAHAIAWARGVSDTSREGRYHNRTFRLVSEEVGLEVADPGSRGWEDTTPTEETRGHYDAPVQTLIQALAERPPPPEAPRVPNRNLSAAECACPRKIRAARAVLAGPAIICQACGQPFTPKTR